MLSYETSFEFFAAWVGSPGYSEAINGDDDFIMYCAGGEL